MLKKRKPLTTGTRWKKLPLMTLGKSLERVRTLSYKLHNIAGINSYGKKVARFRCRRDKVNYYIMPLKKDYLRVPATVCHVFNVSYRSAPISCLRYLTGSYCYSPALHGMKVGSIVTWVNPWSLVKYHTKYNFNIGSIIELKKLPRFSIISNISLKGDHKSVYAKSAGTYCFISEILNELGLYIIKLPSGSRKIISSKSLVQVGRNANVSQKYSIKGKAGISISKGSKQIVRGVAMNPVDHPNGGRTKTNKPEKSIWGWIAKRGS